MMGRPRNGARMVCVLEHAVYDPHYETLKVGEEVIAVSDGYDPVLPPDCFFGKLTRKKDSTKIHVLKTSHFDPKGQAATTEQRSHLPAVYDTPAIGRRLADMRKEGDAEL